MINRTLHRVRLLYYGISYVVVFTVIYLTATSLHSSINVTNEQNIHNVIIDDNNTRIDTEETFCKKETAPAYLSMRASYMGAECSNIQNTVPKKWKSNSPTMNMLMKLRWDRKHGVVYCHVPKVASTTWSWYFLRASGLSDEEIQAHDNIHILLKERLPPPNANEKNSNKYNNTLKFLVARHPYERLVSAYQNKIADINNRRSQYRKLQKTILGKYRPGWNSSDLTSVPTFREFATYVLSEVETWLEQQRAHYDERVRMLLPDLHWLPITYICSPCQIEYDVISKFETMEADSVFIAEACGMKKISKEKLKMNQSQLFNKEGNDVSITQNTTGSYSSNTLKYQHYIGQLPKYMERRLFALYAPDFKLFNYTVN